jgi:hypothetical protein
LDAITSQQLSTLFRSDRFLKAVDELGASEATIEQKQFLKLLARSAAGMPMRSSGNRWDPLLVRFAQRLHATSAPALSFVRSVLPLPGHTTIHAAESATKGRGGVDLNKIQAIRVHAMFLQWQDEQADAAAAAGVPPAAAAAEAGQGAAV